MPDYNATSLGPPRGTEDQVIHHKRGPSPLVEARDSIGVATSAFLIAWGALDAFGTLGSPAVLSRLVGIAIVVALVHDVLRIRFRRLRHLNSLIDYYISKLKQVDGEGCCVLKASVDHCPLGVIAIEDRAENTVRESIEMTKGSFKWYGLSAFNVVHRNVDAFRDLHGKRVEFHVLAESMSKALDRHDSKRRSGPTFVSSRDLLAMGVEQILQLKKDTKSQVDVQLWRHKKVHDFRVVQVDDEVAYVSFYETGTDALDSHQLVIRNFPQEQYNVYRWFSQFVDRSKEHSAKQVTTP